MTTRSCWTSARPGTSWTQILEGLNYKNLDEHPDFAGKLSTTEALARYIADAVAAQIRVGQDGRALTGLDVTLRETPDAWASYSLDFDAR